MDFVFDGDLPTKFIRKLNKNIEILETSKSTIDLDLKAMESLPVKGKTNQKEDEAPATVHSILNGPTNTMRAYLRSKTGPFLRMDPDGSLGGTKDMQDKNGEWFIYIEMERISFPLFQQQILFCFPSNIVLMIGVFRSDIGWLCLSARKSGNLVNLTLIK